MDKPSKLKRWLVVLWSVGLSVVFVLAAGSVLMSSTKRARLDPGDLERSNLDRASTRPTTRQPSALMGGTKFGSSRNLPIFGDGPASREATSQPGAGEMSRGANTPEVGRTYELKRAQSPDFQTLGGTKSSAVPSQVIWAVSTREATTAPTTRESRP